MELQTSYTYYYHKNLKVAHYASQHTTHPKNVPIMLKNYASIIYQPQVLAATVHASSRYWHTVSFDLRGQNVLLSSTIGQF